MNTGSAMNTDTNVTQEAEAKETTMVSLIVPKPLWRRVKMLAAETDTTQQDLWIGAMTEKLERQNQQPNATPRKTAR